MWMPPRELEILWVTPLEVVADVGFGVVVRQLYLNSDNEVKLLPTLIVGCPVSDIRFRGGKAAGVLVRRAIDTLPWMISLCRPRQLQFPVFVTDATKQAVGFTEVLFQVASHIRRALSAAKPDINPEFDFLFELPCVTPHPVGEFQPRLLAADESLAGCVVGAEISAILRLCQFPDVVPENLSGEFAVLIVGERPFCFYPVHDDAVHLAVHRREQAFDALTEGWIVRESEQAVSLKIRDGSRQQRSLLDDIVVQSIYLSLIAAHISAVLPFPRG